MRGFLLGTEINILSKTAATIPVFKILLGSRERGACTGHSVTTEIKSNSRF